MKTIVSEFIYQTEVNKSQFITHLVPISKFESLKEELKLEHPKASHIVYALRYVNEFDQVVENYSDDGEPKGCAGVPSINVLRGEDFINCAILTVRYFGGTKLGTGGMVRAYSLAVKNVIGICESKEYVKEITYSFETTYSDVEKTLYRLKKLDITNIKRDFGVEKVKWDIVTTPDLIERFKEEG